MRRFNPEKELRKIQHGNRNKIIFGVIALLLVIAIGSSYALYQVRYSKRVMYTKIGDFYQNDVVLSVYIDGEKKIEPNSFPDKDSGKIFSHVTCKNGGTGYFDNTKWELNLKTTEQDRCDVYFITGNLPNPPELYQGMIPVVYGDTGIMYVADTNSDWYNYQDHRWGNAVLVDASNENIKDKYFKKDNQLREDIVGKEVPMEEVLQMYVWIPRYKYQIFNVGTTGVAKQVINIAFENNTETTGNIKCKYTSNGDKTITEDCKDEKTDSPISVGDWYTHPAFTFKGTLEENGTELPGIWIGKFEPSDPTDPNGKKNVITEITILPNKTSMVSKGMSIMFNATRNIELENAGKYNLNSAEIDTHMTKNIEWGAMSYLTYSVYGIFKPDNSCNIANMTFENCAVWNNNTGQGAGDSSSTATNKNGGAATGCAADVYNSGYWWNEDDNSPAKCKEGNQWNQSDIKASTTGNMYGIYDAAGGAGEYVVVANIDENNKPKKADTIYTSTEIPNNKYFDLYTDTTEGSDRQNSHFGDAVKEVFLINDWRSWDKGGNMATYSDLTGPAGNRRGGIRYGPILDICVEWPWGGMPYTSFRVVLTAQDGNE